LSRIARHLGITRKSVRKVVQRRSGALPRAAPRPRTTALTPFRTRLQALRGQDPARSAVNVLQVLRAAGYRGGISALRALGRRLRPGPTREAFVPLTFGVAEAAQVDWGEFGDVFGIGRAVHAFVLVLCYSRLLPVPFTFSQPLEAFLRCPEQAFALLNGVTRDCWYDHAATGGAERRGRLVRFPPRFLAYAGHHGLRPVAGNIGRGNEQGRVEDAIKVPADELLAGAPLPGSRGSQRPGAGVARYRRQPTGAPRDAEGPEPARGRGAAAPRAPPRALRHGRGAERRRPAQLPRGLRQQPRRWRGPLAVGREAAHAAGGRGDGDPLVRPASGGAACPRLGARSRGRVPRPRGGPPRHQARRAGALAGAGRGGPRAVRAAGPSRASGPGTRLAGARSLRAELDHLLLLATGYGPRPVEAALAALLAQAIVGSHHVAQWPRLQAAPPVAPPPLTLADPRLTVPPGRPDLQGYDALLWDGDREPAPPEDPPGDADA